MGRRNQTVHINSLKYLYLLSYLYSHTFEFTIINSLSRYEALYNDAKVKSKDLLRPLETELRELEEQIQDKQAEILVMKGTIIRNESKQLEMYKARVIVA